MQSRATFRHLRAHGLLSFRGPMKHLFGWIKAVDWNRIGRALPRSQTTFPRVWASVLFACLCLAFVAPVPTDHSPRHCRQTPASDHEPTARHAGTHRALSRQAAPAPAPQLAAVSLRSFLASLDYSTASPLLRPGQVLKRFAHVSFSFACPPGEQEKHANEKDTFSVFEWVPGQHATRTRPRSFGPPTKPPLLLQSVSPESMARGRMVGGRAGEQSFALLSELGPCSGLASDPPFSRGRSLTMESSHDPSPSIADQSAPLAVVSLARLHRTEKNRLYKAAQRDRERASGRLTIEIKLNPEEAEAFRALQLAQNGPVDDFAKRALLTGAKFLYNAGNRRGGKKRVSTVDDARRIQLADCAGVVAGDEDSGPDRENPADSQNA